MNVSKVAGFVLPLWWSYPIADVGDRCRAPKSWAVPSILGWSNVTSSLEEVTVRQLPVTKKGRTGKKKKARGILQFLGASFV